MLRLYVPVAADADGRVRLPRPEVRHLRTLRLGPGDRVRIFDGAGREHEVTLESVGAREAVGRIVSTSAVARESPLELVLVPALVKHDRMDVIVEKATELGVTRIAPVVTRYSVARGSHLERWRRIAVAAAKQCGRSRMPAVDDPADLADALGAAWPGLRLIAWEDGGALPVRELPAEAGAVTIVVGPEGGFHASEVAAARAAGFTTITLGRRILRAETASIVAAALCQHRWGDG
jgi:16S rRNA (uracil1498-N3)-methyltransferase